MGKRIRLILAPIFLFLFSIMLASREKEIRFVHISLDQGLSQSSVYCITQDKRGFLWTGTEDGVNKYDGSTFITYRSPHVGADSERVNANISIAADQNGILWLGTFGRGLERFDPRYEKFDLYQSDPKIPNSLCGNFIWSIMPDKTGILWIGTDNGINRLDPVSGRMDSYRAQPSTPGKLNYPYIYSLFPDRYKNRLWIGTLNGGLSVLDTDSGIFSSYAHQPDNENSLAGNSVKAVFQDSRGYVWVGTLGAGLDRLDPETGKFTHFKNNPDDPASLSDNNIRVIFGDKDNNLWIGTDKGLNLFQVKSGSFSRFQEDLGNLYSLSRNQVRAIFQDQSGSLWIGTLMGGLNKFSSEKERFYHYRSLPGLRPSLSNDAVFSIWEENNDILWIGTFNGGLNRFDRSRNQYNQYRHNPNNPRSLSSDNVWVVFTDSRNDIWVGTDRGLNRFHRESEIFSRYLASPGESTASANQNIYAINEDKEGYLWVGANDGLHRLSAERREFFIFQTNPQDPSSLSHNKIRAICRDRRNDLWIGTFGGGLNLFLGDPKNPGSGTFSRFLHRESDKNSLSSNFIYSITEDRAGILWIGTRGAGIARLDRKTGIFSRFGVEKGLASNVVYGILEDKRGILWCSTNQGISRINPYSRQVKNYDRRDGLQSNEFNMGSFHRSAKTGEMFFGGINGFNAFFPDEIKDSNYSHPVVISELKIFNRPVRIGDVIEGVTVLNKSITDCTEITLSHVHTVFSIRYASLHFVSPERNRYKYIMEGVDEQWTETDNNTATFAHLPPKTYTFRVMGANQDGVWSREAASLKITITPPFYKTWWFYVLTALILMVSFLVFLHLRDRQQRRQERILSKLVKERTQELEKVNNIVKSINSKVELDQLLNSIVNEAIDIQSGYEATILVHSHNDQTFYEMAHLGGDHSEIKRKPLPHEWVEEQYIQNANEISEDIFLAMGENGRHRLIIRVKVERDAEGYIIFESEEEEPVFENTNIQLLTNLKDHIASAFIKDKLLYELHKAKEKAEKERREAEAANRYKSEFLARMSHEIRTPMNSVIGFSDLLLETRLDEEQYDFTRTIRHSAEALLTIINEILDLSRIEAGRFFLEPSEFSPEMLAFSICELLAPKIEDKSLEILCSTHESVPPAVIGDQGRYRQVLINLMSNAAKFTHSGEIELSLRVDGASENRIRLIASVRDTGIGIHPDQQTHIFEPFQQADISNTRKYDGAGLGLSICKEIAHLMNGDITVTSVPGQGSVFYFTSWMEKSSRPPVPFPHRDIIAGRQILAADDNPRGLQLLTEILQSMNAAVTAVSDGKAALDAFLNAIDLGKPFELVILDVHLPLLDGYEIARRIRNRNDAFGNIPILALTSTVERRSKLFLESQFNGFLPKPVQKQRLLEKLHRLIGDNSDDLDKNARRSSGNAFQTENTGGKTDAASDEPVSEASTNPAPDYSPTQSLLPPINYAKTPSSAAFTPAAPEEKKSAHILLAEDNPVNQKLIRFLLSPMNGYTLEIVENGRILLDTFLKRPADFDLILMDIQMPEVDGMEAAATLRQKGFSIPIIAMTASSMRGDREKCIAAGMNDYLSKPIVKEHVFQILQKWLK